MTESILRTRLGVASNQGVMPAMFSETHDALWWEPSDSGKVKCLLCPRLCDISEGSTGFCSVRKNDGGRLVSLSYGHLTALQIDPIEKKPLAHFMPGTRTFSMGAQGCNLGCVFCQNHHLSRCEYQERIRYRYYSPSDIVALAMRHGCESLSFTYNEPSTFGEYVLDTAKIARESGLATVFVSNAFITLPAAKDIYPLIDAANIDVKGFSEEFYRSMCKGALKPVLEAAELYKSTGGHLELTYLVIPGRNNSLEMLDAYLDWVAGRLGIDTPLHFTAYHPDYIYDASPRTPIDMLRSIQSHANGRGFPNVHLGNIC